MGLEFLDKLAVESASIPAEVFRIAGFILVMQAILIVFQKKNSPSKGIWEDLSGVLMAGLVVFLFPELIKLAEITVNSVCHVEREPSSAFAELWKSTLTTKSEHDESRSLMDIMLFTFLAKDQSISFIFANMILKPIADFINTLLLPGYFIVRGLSLQIVYFAAPLILMLGAVPSFRSLWKQWFLIYIALLFSGPALILADNLCEKSFAIYIGASGSPLLGFFVVAFARFKAFSAVVDLCSRIFR